MRGKKLEAIDHLFIPCEVAYFIWGYLLKHFEALRSSVIRRIDGCLEGGSFHVRSLVIWKEWNEGIFKNKVTPLADVLVAVL